MILLSFFIEFLKLSLFTINQEYDRGRVIAGYIN